MAKGLQNLNFLLNHVADVVIELGQVDYLRATEFSFSFPLSAIGSQCGIRIRSTGAMNAVKILFCAKNIFLVGGLGGM